MKPTLSLSTAWCSHRHGDGLAMVQEMADLGFTHAELSHGIRITLVDGILRGVEQGVIKIGSVHNFCPLPPGVTQAAPNLYEPSAIDSTERDQWVRQTKRTIDFAAKVKARVVVCHLGSAFFLWFNPVRKLQTYLAAHPDAGRLGDKKYQALLAKAVGKLRQRMGRFWDNTRDSVGKVLAYAAEKNVILGFENREKFEELPVDADFPSFLAGLPAGAAAGYWHDTGHAEIKQDLGLLTQKQQLTDNAARLIGFHLHDVNADGDDHQSVGSGRVDFAMISEFWRPYHTLVLEIGPRATVEEVRSSKARLDELLQLRGLV
jgi:sugar phosphate isomerase/epimerase